MRVLFTPRAERQIARLHHYIEERSGQRRADGYIGRIIGFCQGLGVFPHRGASRDDLLPGLRTVGFERRATVAFTLTENAVIIEGIFYGGPDVPQAFAPR